MNNDKKATLAGAVLAALTAVTIDTAKLLSGDLNVMAPEIVKVVTALTMGVLGWLANRQDKPKE